MAINGNPSQPGSEGSTVEDRVKADEEEEDTCKGKAHFTISGRTYSLHPEQWCGLIRPAGDRIHEQLHGLTDDPKLAHHTWLILGEAFLQSFYTVFDNDDTSKPQICLAPVCKQSQVMCVGKEGLCNKHEEIRSKCPITCKVCGVDNPQELDLIQFEP